MKNCNLQYFLLIGTNKIIALESNFYFIYVGFNNTMIILIYYKDITFLAYVYYVL